MTDHRALFDEDALLEELRQIHLGDRPSDAVRQRASRGVRERMAAEHEDAPLHEHAGADTHELVRGWTWMVRSRAAAWVPWAVVISAVSGVGAIVALSQTTEPPAVALVAEPDPSSPGVERGLVRAPASSGASQQGPCPAGEANAGRAKQGEVARPLERGVVSPRSFEQSVPGACAVARRYLEYVPEGLALPAAAPVLVLIHDASDSAEDLRDVQTLRRFDELARRDGFIAVYASALPDSTRRASRRWRLENDPEPEIDDEAYLAQVLEDMRRRGVLGSDTPALLLGHGQGAELALRAAAHRPDLYYGVAALMPETSSEVVPQLGSEARLSRVLFMSRSRDSRAMVHDWALALGIPHVAIERSRPVPLPDRAVEGQAYADPDAVREGSLGSRVERFDLVAPDAGGPAVRALFISPNAGRSLPALSSEDEPGESASGYRNRDIDAAEEAWNFLRGALEP